MVVPVPSPFLSLRSFAEFPLRKPALVALAPHVPLTPDLELQPLRQRVHHGGADAVQPARDLVALAVKLAAGVQRREDDLGRRLAVLSHRSDRHPPPVVGDGDGVIGVDGYQDLRAVPGECLVYGIVDDLPNEVVETSRPRGSNVHTRPPLDGLEALQDLDRTCIVRACSILGNRVSRQRTGPSS